MITSVLEANLDPRYNQQIVNLLHIPLQNLQELQHILAQTTSINITYPSIHINIKYQVHIITDPQKHRIGEDIPIPKQNKTKIFKYPRHSYLRLS